MKQIFRPAMNTIARASLFGGLLAFILLGGALISYFWSAYVSNVKVSVQQEVPFSHKHHVDGVGIDCRFCHTSAEDSSFAGIPATSVCMKCHSVLFTEAQSLEPVRESARTGKPLEWIRVHDLPDHVYFDHSIHVSKGISCQECHGNVGDMPLMKKQNTLHMGWCLDCHRHPETHLRPREEVFNQDWNNSENTSELQKELYEKYNVKTIQNCSACHR